MRSENEKLRIFIRMCNEFRLRNMKIYDYEIFGKKYRILDNQRSQIDSQYLIFEIKSSKFLKPRQSDLFHPL